MTSRIKKELTELLNPGQLVDIAGGEPDPHSGVYYFYHSASQLPAPRSYSLRPSERWRVLDASVFDDVFAQVSEYTAERATASIHALLACTHRIEGFVAELASAVRRTIVPVNALPRTDLRLRRAPLFVSIEQDDEFHFVAEIFEVGAVGYGDTIGDAVDDAVAALGAIYDEVGRASLETLGPRPRKWRAALDHLIERLDG